MKGISSASLWIVIFLIFILVFMQYNSGDKPDILSIMDWQKKGEQGLVISSVAKDGKVTGKYYPDAKNKTLQGEKRYVFSYDDYQSGVMAEWAKQNNIPLTMERSSALLSSMLISVLAPLVIFIIFWMLIMRQLQGGGNKAMSFGKSTARLVTEGEIKFPFKDEAGSTRPRKASGSRRS